jgi:FAD synthase
VLNTIQGQLLEAVDKLKAVSEAGNLPIEENFKNSKASCMGGTFDSMHLGHKVFLSVGAMSSEFLLVGVTQ